MSNWLGDELDDGDLAILAVDLSGLEIYSEVEYELITDRTIPGEKIMAVLKEEPGFPVDYEYCSLASIEQYLCTASPNENRLNCAENSVYM